MGERQTASRAQAPFSAIVTPKPCLSSRMVATARLVSMSSTKRRRSPAPGFGASGRFFPRSGLNPERDVPERSGQGSQDRLAPQGLCHHGIKGVRELPGKAVGTGQEQLHARPAGIGSDTQGEGGSIHPRKAEIKDSHLDPSPRGGCLFQRSQGRDAAICLQDFDAKRREMVAQDFAVKGQVVHDKGKAATEILVEPMGLWSRHLGTLGRNLERKGGSQPGLALHRDAAPHQRNELAADGEAEACSAKASSDRRIGLGEFLEEPAPLL